MEALVLVALAVVILAVRARPSLAEPLPPLPEGYTGPMVVKAPRAGRLAATASQPADRTGVAA